MPCPRATPGPPLQLALRLRLACAALALLAACGTAAAATPEAVAELRDHGFAFISHRLADGPIDDVPWSSGMTVSVEAIDLPRGLLTAAMGKSRMQVPLKTVDGRQLAQLLARGAGGKRPDLEGCAMAAALFRLAGDAEAARLALETAKLHESGVDERFAAWATKLGLDEPAKAAAEPKAEPADAGDKPARAAKEKDPAKAAAGSATKRHPVAKDHPRLFGPRSRLQALAQEREPAFKAMLELARKPSGYDPSDVPSLAFAYAVTGDKALGRAAIDRCLPLIRGPIRVGHETFGGDLALCAYAFDGCFDLWTAEEKAQFYAYYDKTVDANVGSETSPFHNGWWGYKNFGIGLAGYATYWEDPRSPEFLKTLEADYGARAAPALELAGDGGGWAEGHYLYYWISSWLTFAEAARWCEGVDYYALAPKFYGQRALDSLFDIYPGDKPEELNRPIPRGDGGYGEYGGVVENVLTARRILCGYYKADPVHQAIAAYNDRIPSPGFCIPGNGWRTWLFDDRAYPRGDWKTLPLSHLAAGPGDVYARSSWDGDATWFYFHCGDRFTAHQHLDVNHFMIYRRAPQLGDAGVYDSFGGDHDTNFYTRTIAHNTILIHDANEKWPAGIRAFAGSTANDGGQAYPWLGTPIGHNGAVVDVAAWQANRALDETGDLLAFDDGGAYVYTAGDGTKAYSPDKCALFTRQIVFLRPSTFVVFDRVKSRRPDQKKYWIANLHGVPPGLAQPLVSTFGDGRLFLQTVLPADPEVTLHSGADIYAFFGQNHPPKNAASGPVPQCRVEVSARKEEETGLFLHVLTATDARIETVPSYAAKQKSGEVAITVGPATITFATASVGGSLTINGAKHALTPNLK